MDKNEPKPLPLNFERKSGEIPFKFRQIEKTENGYIYEVDDEGVIHYEVFEKKIGLNYNQDGYVIYYPTTPAFGVWAWCCRSLEKAKMRLNNFT